MRYDPMQYEPILSAFSIENFGGSPPDDGEVYTANDVMTGFGMRVGALIEDAAAGDRHHEANTYAAHLAASSEEKGIRGARLIAKAWQEWYARRYS